MSSIADVDESFFPRESDFEGLIAQGAFESVRRLLKDESVFLSCHKEDAANILKRYYFKEEFYRAAFEQIHIKEHGVALTGVRFSGFNDLSKILEFIQENRNKPLPKNPYRARFINAHEESKNTLKATIQYDKINPKFATYRRRETYEFEATINLLPDDSCQFKATQAISTDLTVLREISLNLISKVNATVNTTDLTELPIKSRVDLFDAIVRDNTKNVWRIGECKGFSVRNESEDTETSLSNEKNSTLHHAILDGENLRDHYVVNELITDNCYFSSTTFLTYNNSDPSTLVRLKVDFKRSPIILVITAENMQIDEGSGKLITRAIDRTVGDSCVEYFWNYVHALFEAEKRKLEQVSKKIARNR